MAFAGSGSWRLLCPYDLDSLGAEVLAEVGYSHPLVTGDGQTRLSQAYPGVDRMRGPFDAPLPDAKPGVAALTFGEHDLRSVRRFVSEQGRLAGLDRDRTSEAVLAVNEIAANSVRHAGGWGLLRAWPDGDALVCEVLDEGHIDRPLLGRERPPTTEVRGRGVWLANQLCDLVQIRTGAAGNTVRLHLRRR